MESIIHNSNEDIQYGSSEQHNEGVHVNARHNRMSAVNVVKGIMNDISMHDAPVRSLTRISSFESNDNVPFKSNENVNAFGEEFLERGILLVFVQCTAPPKNQLKIAVGCLTV